MKEESDLIPISKVNELTGFSESSIRRYAKDENNTFPAGKAITKRNVRWSRKKVLEYIDNLGSSL